MFATDVWLLLISHRSYFWRVFPSGISWSGWWERSCWPCWPCWCSWCWWQCWTLWPRCELSLYIVISLWTPPKIHQVYSNAPLISLNHWSFLFNWNNDNTECNISIFIVNLWPCMNWTHVVCLSVCLFTQGPVGASGPPGFPGGPGPKVGVTSLPAAFSKHTG